MTTFTELVNDVVVVTGRPDLLADIQLAVRASTLKAHHSDFYYPDLVETGIQFESAAQLQELQYKSLFPNWRKLRYIREYDDGVAGAFLEIIAPEDSVDAYGLNRGDVCYHSGMSIKIRSSSARLYYLLGYFVNPNTTADGYASWIADHNPYIIVNEAAAQVVYMTGRQEVAAMLRQNNAELLRELKMNFVSEVGF